MERRSLKDCKDSFSYEIVLRKRNSTLFSSRRSALSVEPTKAAKFLKKFRYILYCMVKERKFLKGKYCICKGLIHVSCI